MHTQTLLHVKFEVDSTVIEFRFFNQIKEKEKNAENFTFAQSNFGQRLILIVSFTLMLKLKVKNFLSDFGPLYTTRVGCTSLV